MLFLAPTQPPLASMKPTNRVTPYSQGRWPVLLFAVGAALGGAGSAQAQYKVVQPDGSTTYTDRPPVTTNARITSMNRKGTALPADLGATGASLPIELRQAAQRHPVTLYASADCGPCDNGRRFLQQRGIPYSEKRIVTDEDASALEKVLGARSVPGLTIGAQPLRGFSESDWGAYLDAAGYPRESMLPKNWIAVPVQPLTEKAIAGRAPVATRTDDAPVLPELPSASVGTRF